MPNFAVIGALRIYLNIFFIRDWRGATLSIVGFAGVAWSGVILGAKAWG